MRKLAVFALPLVLYFGAGFAALAEGLSPDEVAKRFWTAVKANDKQAVEEYVSAESSESDNLGSSLPPIEEFELGKIVIDGERAWVETTLAVSSEDTVNIPFETVLVREKDHWKVSYEETVALLAEAGELARALKGLESLADQFSEKIDQSLEELQRSLPKVQRGLKEIEKKLKAELPEIQKQLEGLAKEFEDLFESLQETPPSEQERAI